MFVVFQCWHRFAGLSVWEHSADWGTDHTPEIRRQEVYSTAQGWLDNPEWNSQGESLRHVQRYP